MSWWLRQVRRLLVLAAPILLIVLVADASDARLQQFGQLGLVTPAIAALVALVVVFTARMMFGRFTNGRRKGALSPSSATIAVKLWALCYALLLGGMLLSAILVRLPALLDHVPSTELRTVETQTQVSTNQAAPTVTTVRVVK